MKWEYIMSVQSCRSQDELQALFDELESRGEEGYELAAMVPLEVPATVGRGGTGDVLLVMKRPKVEPKPETKAS